MDLVFKVVPEVTQRKCGVELRKSFPTCVGLDKPIWPITLASHGHRVLACHSIQHTRRAKRMNVPHGKFSVVGTPRMRSGAGFTEAIARRCAVNSFSKMLRHRLEPRSLLTHLQSWLSARHHFALTQACAK
jgi:hypothetical protein